MKNSDWEEVGSSRLVLKEQLESLYWDGVKQELKAILFTLKKLQQTSCRETLEHELGAAHNDALFGFETFIDQVSFKPRQFASSYGIPQARFINGMRNC